MGDVDNYDIDDDIISEDYEQMSQPAGMKTTGLDSSNLDMRNVPFYVDGVHNHEDMNTFLHPTPEFQRKIDKPSRIIVTSWIRAY
jgi:hypothetical protein